VLKAGLGDNGSLFMIGIVELGDSRHVASEVFHPIPGEPLAGQRRLQ